MGVIEVSETVRVHMLLVSVAVLGGSLGGFANAIAEHIFEFLRLSGDNGWITNLHEHESFTAGHYMQHRIMWGAVWGLLFCAPLHKHIGSFWLRCGIFALIPTLWSLAWSIPHADSDAGFFSLGLGILTPLFVFFSYTTTWAVPAYLWVGLAGFGGTVDTSVRGGEPDVVADVDNLLP
eukprot:jgi/Ulvmu1/12473/UM009_0125.1